MSFRSLALGSCLLASLAALAGCVASPDVDDEAEVGVAQDAIKGGYDDPNDTAVVQVRWVQGMYEADCTGSLLAPNLVLTARHCVANMKNSYGGAVDCSVSKFAVADQPQVFSISTKQVPDYFKPTDYHDVSEVLTPEPASACGYDVALFVLAQNVDPNEAKPLVPRVDSQIEHGMVYSAIGYGGTVDDGTNSGRRRRLDNLVVDCVGSQCPDYYVESGHEWQGDHGICEGDSGGPAIDPEYRVVGVTSRGASGCTAPVYGGVYPWADWIKQTALHAAEVGGYEPPMWAQGYSTEPKYNFPIGNDCPSGCASGICVTDPAGQYCTRECSDVGPCPDGFSCNVQKDGSSICQKPAPAKKDEGGGCSVSPDGADPTKPVPWHIGAGIAALGALALRRRRRSATSAG